MKKLGLMAAAAFMAAALHGQAQAAWVYVGSWEVSQGPNWNTQPLAYSGQQAAAFLFGGAASDYAISTTGTDPLQIDHAAWYSVIGYFGPNNGGTLFAEDYLSVNSSQASGLYSSGDTFRFDDSTEAASAYVNDNASTGNVNYAFRYVDAPEPATLALLGVGLVGLAMGRRTRGRATV